jgi:hypothetical protein
MKRREFIRIATGAAIGWPLGARVQQKAMPVIGFLGLGSPGPTAPFVAAFRQGLGETGYVDGQNLTIEYRWAEGSFDRLPGLAADLVGRKVDVIATSGGEVSALAAKSATSTIPIVSVSGGDPVATGLVASLARPDGNLTGFTALSLELMPKQLELLSELVPQARVIALLVNPNNPNTERIMRDVHEAARTKGVQLPYPEGHHRSRDRRRLCRPRPTASRRARRPGRSVLQQPARAVRGAGITPCRSCDLWIPRIRHFRGPDQLWSEPRGNLPTARHLRRKDPQGRQAR